MVPNVVATRHRIEFNDARAPIALLPFFLCEMPQNLQLDCDLRPQLAMASSPGQAAPTTNNCDLVAAATFPPKAVQSLEWNRPTP